jgi:hypothetical protein
MIAARQIAFGKAAGKGLSAKDYIQDGLVAMWDGIENAGWGRHDDSVLTMADLISNVATITFTKSKDGMWFFNRAWKNTYISSLNISAEEYTLECVVMKPTDEPASPRYYPVATIASSEGQYVSWKPSNDLARMYVAARDSETATNTYKTWSYLAGGFTESIVCDMSQTKAYGYTNGDYCGSKNDISLTGRTVSALRFNGDSSPAWISNIRIYSRALIAAEIAANYAVDKARFNIWKRHTTH